jgi:hypothetical protein
MDYFVGIDSRDLAVCGLRQKYVRQQLMLYNTFANKLSGHSGILFGSQLSTQECVQEN